MAEAEISNQPGARLTNTELVEKYMPAWQLANDMRTSRAFEELGRVINDNFDQILTIEAKAKQIRPGWHDVYVDKAHSSFLEVLATTGIVGLFIYLTLISKTISALIKNKIYKPFLLAFILFLFHSQTNVISIAEEIVFWLIVGITAFRS